jgi:hypothetical protein
MRCGADVMNSLTKSDRMAFLIAALFWLAVGSGGAGNGHRAIE